MVGIAWFTPSFEIESRLRFVAGGIVIAFGVFIVVLGVATLWRARTTIDPVDLDRDPSFVTGGFFRYTRNPMYLGYSIALVGSAICLAAE